MSYFGSEKRLLMSVSALYAISTQDIGPAPNVVSIFDGVTPTPLTSSIEYPAISVSSNVVTLQSGYKYLVDCRFKVSDASPSAGEAISYYLADLASTQISSTGILNITSDSSAALGQERCIAYIDATSEAKSFTIRMQKNSIYLVTLNSTIDPETTNFKSHILIKAWK